MEGQRMRFRFACTWEVKPAGTAARVKADLAELKAHLDSGTRRLRGDVNI